MPEQYSDKSITPFEFLDEIFSEADPDTEVVCVSKMIPDRDGGSPGFWNISDQEKPFRTWKPLRQNQAWYFCVSTVDGEKNAKGTAVRRRTQNAVRYHVLVLDDIGTKAEMPPVEPTYRLTSSVVESQDNEQWAYKLVPGSDMMRYEALLEYCHEKGWGDAGAGGCYRIMRVPGSANLKPGRDNFKSVITEWFPDDVWELDELAVALGCDDLDERAATRAAGKKPPSKMNGHAVLPALDNIDPLYDWLRDNSHIVQDDGGEFIDIKCPWADEHTTGSDTAGYSPLGRGSDDWVQARGFSCLHEHCKGRKFGDFIKAVGALGAPRVSGVDPLPWLQHKFTYIGMGARVADLEQRKIGGKWLWDLEDWGKMHKGRVVVPGREQPIEMKSAFLESKKTVKVTDTVYWPVKADADVAVVETNRQKFVNIYAPPSHEYTKADPDVFLDHVDFLLPDVVEADLFLDWLAHKIQNPGMRSYAVVMIAEDSFGVGRSWLREMLKMVLGANRVQTATLPQLIGKGTSAENNYNDWACECQFLVVEEARDNISREDFYNGYETFKTNVDTRITSTRVNPKYGKTREDYMFFNALIFSNHSDALAVPSNDRRLCVLTNPSVMAEGVYYDRLESSLTNVEAAKIYWYLMERDIDEFDHVYPPMTRGKRLMTDQNVLPSMAISEHILDALPGDIVTKKLLKAMVVGAAHELDYDNIVSNPGTVVRTLWGKMGKLRDDARGARYYLNGAQTEVRAVRQQEKWIVTDKERDRDAIGAELLKNQK
jgi:hypothetical protein